MMPEQELVAQLELMLMTHGTVETTSLSISGSPDGTYSLRLDPLPVRIFPDAASAAQGCYRIAEEAVDTVIRAGALLEEHRQEALDEARTWLFPSCNMDDYWISAQLDVGEYPEHTERGGKWLLFVPTSDVDGHWSRVVQALDAGSLGGSAKVATARKNPHELGPKERVICVYTYDADDYADVSRVREALRETGYTRKLPYKMDDATLAGRYSKGGRVSRYYE